MKAFEMNDDESGLKRSGEEGYLKEEILGRREIHWRRWGEVKL